MRVAGAHRPRHLPVQRTLSICALALRRYATFAISLPGVVGLAGWPCVRDIIGVSASVSANAATASAISSMYGRRSGPGAEMARGRGC